MSVEAQKSIDAIEEFLKSLIYRFRQFQKNQGQKNQASTQDKAPSLDNTVSQDKTAPEKGSLIEIKIGKEIIYRGREGEPAEVNRLTPTRIKLLESVLQVPAKEQEQAAAANPQEAKGTITVKVDGERAFRMEKGSVEVNKFVPPQQVKEQPAPIKDQQQSASAPVQQSTPPEQKAPGPATRQVTPQVSALQITKQRIAQAVSEPSFKRFNGLIDKLQNASLDRQTTKAPILISKQLLKAHPPQHDFVSGGKPSSLAQIQPGYHLFREGKTHTVVNDQGKALLKFESGLLGPRIIENNMNLREQYDLLPQPAAAPAFQNDLRAVGVAATAQSILDRTGGESFEGHLYKIERQGNDLSVYSKDGRGEILSLTNGLLLSALLEKDVQTFQDVNQRFGPQAALDESVVKGAQQIVNHLGSNEANGAQAFEGKQYKIETRGNNMTIEAKDGRGEIFTAVCRFMRHSNSSEQTSCANA
jgi:hypothetical protein